MPAPVVKMKPVLMRVSETFLADGLKNAVVWVYPERYRKITTFDEEHVMIRETSLVPFGMVEKPAEEVEPTDFVRFHQTLLRQETREEKPWRPRPLKAEVKAAKIEVKAAKIEEAHDEEDSNSYTYSTTEDLPPIA